MTCILDRKVSISGLDFLYMFMLLFYAGSASYMARSIGNILTVGNAIILLLTVFVLFQKKITLGKDFLISCVVFLAYASITTFLNKMFNPMWISQWLIWLFIAYVCCKCYRRRFFIVFETIMFWMTLIAMFFWILELVIPDVLESFIRSIAFLQSYSPEVDNANIIFYTIQDELYVSQEMSHIARNPGFAWEPGAFSVFLSLALFCNLIRTGWRLRNNMSLYVYAIAIISTQSTTGIVIMFISCLMKLLLDKKILAASLLLVPIVVAFFTLPFLLPKIQSEIIGISNFTYEDISYGSNQLGRLQSFYLAMQDFKMHPVFGLGGYAEGTILHELGFNDVALISGFGELLSKYGIIMTLFFIFSIVYSSKVMTEQFNSSYSFILIPIFIGMCISYSLWRNPLVMAFWLYGYYCQQKYIKVQKIVKEQK